jgi:hypothetical protein
MVPGSDAPQEVIEYLVIEKKISSGVESSCFIWGTTNETLPAVVS